MKVNLLLTTLLATITGVAHASSTEITDCSSHAEIIDYLPFIEPTAYSRAIEFIDHSSSDKIKILIYLSRNDSKGLLPHEVERCITIEKLSRTPTLFPTQLFSPATTLGLAKCIEATMRKNYIFEARKSQVSKTYGVREEEAKEITKREYEVIRLSTEEKDKPERAFLTFVTTFDLQYSLRECFESPNCEDNNRNIGIISKYLEETKDLPDEDYKGKNIPLLFSKILDLYTNENVSSFLIKEIATLISNNRQREILSITSYYKNDF